MLKIAAVIISSLVTVDIEGQTEHIALWDTVIHSVFSSILYFLANEVGIYSIPDTKFEHYGQI